jgi:hypothetical protein
MFFAVELSVAMFGCGGQAGFVAAERPTKHIIAPLR